MSITLLSSSPHPDRPAAESALLRFGTFSLALGIAPNLSHPQAPTCQNLSLCRVCPGRNQGLKLFSSFFRENEVSRERIPQMYFLTEINMMVLLDDHLRVSQRDQLLEKVCCITLNCLVEHVPQGLQCRKGGDVHHRIIIDSLRLFPQCRAIHEAPSPSPEPEWSICKAPLQILRHTVKTRPAVWGCLRTRLRRITTSM